jgi:eukaryotic-like serine/threonine-protein kinase
MARRVALCAEAERLLEDAGEVAPISALANLLYATWARRSPESRLALTERMMELAERSHDPADLFWIASPSHLNCLLERVDLAGAVAEIERLGRRIETLPDASGYRWYPARFGALRALLAGRFAEAERLIFEALDLARRAKVFDPELSFGLQLSLLRAEQGRHAELLGPLRAAVTRYPHNSGWRAGLVHALVETDAHGEARSELERWAAAGLPDPDEDHNAPVSLYWLAAPCRELALPQVAAAAHARLLPFAGRLAVPLEAAVCYGSFDLVLGQLSLAAGRLDEAEQHLQAARATHERLDARPALARTQCELAHLHLARRGPDDSARARDLVTASIAAAEALGMARLAAQAREVGARASSVVPLRATRRQR